MAIIYGVDTEKPVSPKDVSAAIVQCFTAAHAKELADLQEFAEDLNDAEFEAIKKINVEQMVRNYFNKTGGDFEEPTKESIVQVLEKLQEFAKHFRDPSVIQKHYEEIMELVGHLK